MSEAKLSPLMQQYFSLKEKYDAIVLFRVGDFYEVIGEDAQTVSEALGTVLTKRRVSTDRIEKLTGFPCTCIEDYLQKLVKSGHRVALVDPNRNIKRSAINGIK